MPKKVRISLNPISGFCDKIDPKPSHEKGIRPKQKILLGEEFAKRGNHLLMLPIYSIRLPDLHGNPVTAVIGLANHWDELSSHLLVAQTNPGLVILRARA